MLTFSHEHKDTGPVHTAVVYYSLTGHSEHAAKRLAEGLDCALIEVSAPSYATGFLGYLRAGYDSLRQRYTLPPQTFTTLRDFDRVVICGPIWTSYPAPPLRALLKGDIDLPEEVALFLTHGDNSPPEKAYGVAEQDLGRLLIATGALSNDQEGTASEFRILTEFLARISPRAVIKSVS